MSEGLAEGPYVVARAGVEPTTLRMIGVDSTNEPQHPTNCGAQCSVLLVQWGSPCSVGIRAQPYGLSSVSVSCGFSRLFCSYLNSLYYNLLHW